MRRWVFVGDWLAYPLSGELATDYSITSQTLVLDQRELRLRDDLLDAFGLSLIFSSSPRQAGVRIGGVRTAEAHVPPARAGVLRHRRRRRLARSVSSAAASLSQATSAFSPAHGSSPSLVWPSPAPATTACQSGAICDPHVAPARWVFESRRFRAR